MMWWVKALGLAMMPALVHSYAATDSPQDADPPQSGYLPNHNINPSSVSSSLAIAWKKTFNLNEIFYAKPLVYTPNGAPNEYVITVSNQNIVRVMDGLTGNMISNRTLDAPFASSDTNCGDIPNTVGITGTPIIDTATDIMYFFAKGYQNGQAGPQGTILGQYKFHAVQLPSLTEVSGFPVIIDGHYANNDHTRYFVGGTVLNRPGLAMIGNIVIGGFGGHCDNFNYTGMLVAVSKTPGVGVTNIQAMEASPGAPQPQALDITNQGGGKAGIWQSGMGIAADTNRVFFVTGNARGAGQNGGASGKPASGKVYLSTLEQAVVNMGVDPNTGNLTQQDYFEPYGYDSNNGGDLDFGSGGLSLLDPTTFYGTGVSRIAVAGGKDGKVYFMNANNLGGFAGGNAGADNVLQTIVNDANSIRSGPASYPLEGGYIYISPITDALYAYKFSNVNGVPQFTLAGSTARSNFAGLSVPTVTSYNGAPGTGIVWLADVNYGLQAYNAVPVNGVLVPITLPTAASTGSATKYQRVVFGAGTIYFVRNSVLMMLSGGGQQLSPPVTCTPNPVTFGSVMVASTSTIQVTCTANTAITKPSCNINSAIFQCGSTTLPATVASGATFSFPVVFNLSDAALLQYENGASKPLAPGTQTGTLTVDATAGSGYLPDIVITVSGTALASAGYLTINQTSVSFGGVFIGGAQPSQASRSVILSNQGSSTLTFQGFAWQDYYASGMPYQNVTSSIVGNGYTSPSFPAVGSTLAAGASLTIPLVFSPLSTGISATYLTFWSDGGYTELLMQGTAAQGSAPSSSSTSTSSSSKVSLTSTSSSTSSKVSLTSTSSSSTSSSSVVATSSSSQTSSSSLLSSTFSSSTVSSTTSSSTTSSSSTSTPKGPVTVTNVAGWSYLGCYSESTTGRALNGLLLPIPAASCTVENCAAACVGYTYFGVEYHSECYCGNVINAGSVNQTSSIPSVNGCKDLCQGNANEYCGGANRLNMYQAAPNALSTSSPSTTLSSSTSSSTTLSSSTLSSITSSSTISSSVSITTTFSTSTTSASISTSSTSTSALPYITPPAPQRRSFTWSIGWVEAAPDGFSRPFIGINGQWPCPTISVNMGDIIVLTVTNNLVNESTAIHFHGIHQTNTTYADGPAMVTQCPIQPGGTFVYEFTVKQYGTYWYHAHIGGQYIDGFRGPLYIKDVNAPYRVSQEYGLTLSDLYHQQAPELINYYQSVDNANNNNGAEPVPNSILINEAQNVQFSMVPGKTYLFRIINMGAFTPQYLQFDQHDMTVVEIDGVYTQPYTVSQLFITVAQRYSVIVTAKASSSQNFAIKASMSTSMFFPGVIPATFNTEVSAYLVYNPANPLPPPITITRLPFDDSVFVPYDQQPEFGPVTLPLQITVDFGTNANGQYRGYMNGVDFIPQKVPTLYTALHAPANLVNNPNIYGINSNAIVLPYGAVVELLLQNHDSNAHPFHLHGHNFQVVARDPGGSLFPINPPPGPPMRRDTVQMMGDGSVTIRFVADNPGINLFHCHIEWHVEAGLTVTFIEAPAQLQAMKPYIPVSHKDVCTAQGIAMTGNAAGNTVDYTNLTGANVIANTTLWGSLVNPPTTPAPPYDLS